MVRIKHRYLLVNILYPDGSTGTSGHRKQHALSASEPLPPIVDFRRPSPASLSAGQLVRQIRDHVELLYGDYGSGVVGTGLNIKYFSQATSTFIVRCPREHYRLVWSALTFITQLPRSEARGRGKHAPNEARDEQACIMRVVRVSGTIRKSEEEAIRRARVDVLRAQKQSADGDDGPGFISTLDAIFGADDNSSGRKGIEDDESEEEGDDDAEM